MSEFLVAVRRRLAPWSLAFLVLAAANTARAEDLEIGGTGAALGTMRVLLEAFTKTEPEVSGKVLPSLGSGGGIKALASGAIDLAVSARPLKDKERAAGVTAIKYGTTAIVFAVPESNPTAGLSTAELLAIYRGELKSWSDGTRVRLVLRPKSESDTKLLEGYIPDIEPLWNRLKKNPAIPIAYTDQQTADQIQAMAGGLGTAALSLIRAEGRPLKALALDGVSADEATIADGSYPLTKPFYFVVEREPSPLVGRFLAFVRSPRGQALLRRTGHLPASG